MVQTNSKSKFLSCRNFTRRDAQTSSAVILIVSAKFFSAANPGRSQGLQCDCVSEVCLITSE